MQVVQARISSERGGKDQDAMQRVQAVCAGVQYGLDTVIIMGAAGLTSATGRALMAMLGES